MDQKIKDEIAKCGGLVAELFTKAFEEIAKGLEATEEKQPDACDERVVDLSGYASADERKFHISADLNLVANGRNLPDGYVVKYICGDSTCSYIWNGLIRDWEPGPVTPPAQSDSTSAHSVARDAFNDVLAKTRASYKADLAELYDVIKNKITARDFEIYHTGDKDIIKIIMESDPSEGAITSDELENMLMTGLGVKVASYIPGRTKLFLEVL